MKQNRIQIVLNGIPRGAPFDIHALKSMGVSSALAWKYVKGGWVTRLGRGGLCFPTTSFNATPA